MIGYVRFATLASLCLLLCVAARAGAQSAPAPATYELDPSRSTLQFQFVQAGANSTGKFEKFTVALSLPDGGPGKLDVTVDVNSLNTLDSERDGVLRSPELFDTAKFPTARFVSTAITRKGEDRYEAAGKLTIRDVTRDVRIPFTFQTASEGGKNVGTMTGKFVLRRLDYGVGQGEWKSTEWVANDVTVSFDLRLLPRD